MSKDAYYFPHDSNARHDPKIVAMMSVYKIISYGWYWIIVEILREQKDYKYPLSKKYGYSSLAKELGVTADETTKFIEDCVNEFDLFSTDGEFLWSDSLNQRMVKLDARKDRAKAASDVRWNKEKKFPYTKVENGKKITVLDEKTHEGNEFFSKSRLILVEPNDELPFAEEKPVLAKNTIHILSDSALFHGLKCEIMKTAEFNVLTSAFIVNEKEKCLDWLKGKGARKKDYKAFFRNWLRTAMKSMPAVEKKGMVF